MAVRIPYHSETMRLASWDYGQEAAYFVTICTKDRHRYFGAIVDGQMHPSEIGAIAADEWKNNSEKRPDMQVYLGEFVVMPDHFHGVICIGSAHTDSFNSSPADTLTSGALNSFGPQRKNLASIIRGYKASVTSRAMKAGVDFKWQPSYYEHIIRTEKDLRSIEEYIQSNPFRWQMRENLLLASKTQTTQSSDR